jgi:hypothetical protein
MQHLVSRVVGRKRRAGTSGPRCKGRLTIDAGPPTLCVLAWLLDGA